MKTIVYLSLTAFLLCTFSACKKQGLDSVTAIPDLISEAHINYDKTVQALSLTGVPAPGGTLETVRKTPNWQLPQVRKMSTGPVVILPVDFAEPLIAQTNKGTKIPLELYTRLFVYKDKLDSTHIEYVSYLPDESFVKGGTRFSGFVQVRNLAGIVIKQYWAHDGKILRYQGQPLTGANIRGAGISVVITTCTTLEIYGLDPVSGEFVLDESISLGCTNTYVPDVPVPPAGWPIDGGGNDYTQNLTGSVMNLATLDGPRICKNRFKFAPQGPGSDVNVARVWRITANYETKQGNIFHLVFGVTVFAPTGIKDWSYLALQESQYKYDNLWRNMDIAYTSGPNKFKFDTYAQQEIAADATDWASYKASIFAKQGVDATTYKTKFAYYFREYLSQYYPGATMLMMDGEEPGATNAYFTDGDPRNPNVCPEP